MVLHRSVTFQCEMGRLYADGRFDKLMSYSLELPQIDQGITKGKSRIGKFGRKRRIRVWRMIERFNQGV